MSDDIIGEDELYDLLRKYVGQRVRISSRAVQHSRWVMLTNVTNLSGRVWCYDDAGTAWLVEPEGFTMDVEPIVGSWDMVLGPAQMKAVHDAKEIYGLGPTEIRDRCTCVTCTAAHKQGDEEHDHWVGEQLKMLEPHVEEAPPTPEPEKRNEDDRPSTDTFEGF